MRRSSTHPNPFSGPEVKAALETLSTALESATMAQRELILVELATGLGLPAPPHPDTDRVSRVLHWHARAIEAASARLDEATGREARRELRIQALADDLMAELHGAMADENWKPDPTTDAVIDTLLTALLRCGELVVEAMPDPVMGTNRAAEA